ncbi:MAG: hypothetical protein ABIT09_00540 [Croceibacterium sp.]
MGKPLAAPGANAGRRASKKWYKPFLAELARTSNVAAAARKAQVDTSTAYKTRRDDRAFARQWFDALCEGYDNLEMDLLQRLRDGELEGGAAKTRAKRKFDNATAFRLLAAHRLSVNRTRAQRDDDNESAIYASIHDKLETMRQRAQALPALLKHHGIKPVAQPDAE